MYNFEFSYLCWCRLLLLKVESKVNDNDNSIASKRTWISEAHFGIPINMNEKPTLILINSCHNTMSDKSIEMNLQSTILFTVHDFKQKSTAVFLHFKLLIYNPLFLLYIILLYSPEFYCTVHNLTLQFTILLHYNFNLQSTILLYSPQFWFTVHILSTCGWKLLFHSPYVFTIKICRLHTFTLLSTILLYIPQFYFASTILLYSPQFYFAVYNFTLHSTLFPHTWYVFVAYSFAL